jgi:GT2 family glycosyltransferase/glycosyltransferase involved in cell wall biosynthesis
VTPTAIIVVSWNTRELLAECLASIEATAPAADLETIVVDNASSDGSAAMVRERFPAVRLLANSSNFGFARANNQAIAATTAPYVLMLNSDARLTPGALQRLVARLDTMPRAGLVGAQLRGPDGAFQYSHARFPSLTREALTLTGLGRLVYGPWYPSAGPAFGDRARLVDWVGGACMLARRAALDAVGGLDDGYWLYCEEVDLCLAMQRAGWEVWYEPDAQVTHRIGASAYQLGPEREAHLYRSRLRFFRKHHGAGAARLLGAELIALTGPKLALHATLRRVSGGRLGRSALSVRALRAVVAEAAVEAARLPRPPRGDRGTLLVATAMRSSEQVRDVACAHHPRVDYVELQRRGGTELLDYGVYPSEGAGALLRRVEHRLHFDPYLALHAAIRGRSFDRLLCMSERVGLPLALLHRAGILRVPLAVLFMAWSWRQEAVVTRLGLLEHLHVIGVNSSAMREHLVSLGAPSERVRELRWAIDQRFFAPQPGNGGDMVFSVGEPRHRDYAALFRATDGLAVDVQVRMSGYPYTQETTGPRLPPRPGNVTLLPFLTYAQLRAHYARARAVVLPVADALYPAGLTALLEAMSMAKAVIVTRSRGLRDYVIDGETALVVEPNDTAALRDAVRRVLTDRALARRLGDAARARVEAELNLDRYVEQLAALLDDVPTPGLGLAA